MNHEALLKLFIERTTKTSRDVLVSSDLPSDTVHVTKQSILVSDSYISPTTDLPSLVEQCKRMEWDFDTRQERERARIVAELKTIIRARFSRLSTLNPAQAAALLKELRNGS